MLEKLEQMRPSNPVYIDFLITWQQVVSILVFVALGVGVLIFLLYKLGYASKKSFKAKYDLVASLETKRYFQVQLAFATAVFLFINTLKPEVVGLTVTWFFIRFFIAFCSGVLHAYIADLVLKYYWPGPLSRKLKRLRYTQRVNPKTGNKMVLLSEEEEDVYLDEGMQAEENVFSVDYDVWKDEKSGDIHIEKYQGHLSALECDRCGFITMRLEKEEILKPVTDFSDGEIMKEFHCSYCGRIQRKTVALSHKVREDKEAGKFIYDPGKEKKKVVAVKVDIYSNQDDHVAYEFQNTDQAKKFLEEFGFEKSDS